MLTTLDGSYCKMAGTKRNISMSQIEKKLTSFSARQKTVYSEALETLTLTNARFGVLFF